MRPQFLDAALHPVFRGQREQLVLVRLRRVKLVGDGPVRFGVEGGGQAGLEGGTGLVVLPQLRAHAAQDGFPMIEVVLVNGCVLLGMRVQQRQPLLREVADAVRGREQPLPVMAEMHPARTGGGHVGFDLHFQPDFLVLDRRAFRRRARVGNESFQPGIVSLEDRGDHPPRLR